MVYSMSRTPRYFPFPFVFMFVLNRVGENEKKEKRKKKEKADNLGVHSNTHKKSSRKPRHKHGALN